MQQGDSVEAGGAGGGAAGSEEESGPGCPTAAPTGGEQEERARVQTGRF